MSVSPDTGSLPVWTELRNTQEIQVPVITAPVMLDLSHPFERAVWDLVQLYRRKSADYVPAGEGPWFNFDVTEAEEGSGFNAAVRMELSKKRTRERSLRPRMNDAQNESYADTLRDIANYGIIQYARHLYPEGEVQE